MRVLLLLAVLPLAWTQFPAVCNNDESLSKKKCCPNECFSNVSRGMCIDVTTTVMEGWNSDNDIVKKVCNTSRVPQDVRCQWPIRVFNMVCSCNEGWGGYDCSQCDFGYIDNGNGGCVKRTDNQLRVRRDFTKLNVTNQKDYISVLKRAKNEPVKEWSVVVEEPNATDSSGTVKLQDVSVYDMLVIHHFLATREKDNDQCQDLDMFSDIDFAHEGPTFLTWHRYYLLIVERELQRVAEDMGIHDFELAYWDWSSSQMFTPALFGTPDYSSGSDPIDVSGGLFNGNDWPVLCNYHYEKFLAGKKGVTPGEKECEMVRKLCNVSANREEEISLERGFIKDESSMIQDEPFLPDSSTIKMALTAPNYTGDKGFGNRTEGFVELCAGEGKLFCRFRIEGGKNATHNNLHNAVHIYIGGHMRDVPTASNDPIFFLHHANIDRIFEAWLRSSNGSVPDYEPEGGAIHPGHGPDDYLVPFFPLRTNKDMYNFSSHLGFKYDTLPEIASTDSDNVDECEFRDPDSDMCDKQGTKPPGNQGSGFHVSLYLISVAGTCAVLIVSKLSDIW